MLDLARPLGEIEGVVLYGDHVRPDLVYYLPDEIDLMSSSGAPDVALQVFFEDAALVGSDVDLSEAVGAILGLGVRCGVSADRLDQVRRQLLSRLGRDDLVLAQPPLGARDSRSAVAEHPGRWLARWPARSLGILTQ